MARAAALHAEAKACDALASTEPVNVDVHVRGPLPDEEFQDATGFVTAAGLAHLARVLSRVDPRTLPARRIMTLVCVGDLVDFVAAAGAREA